MLKRSVCTAVTVGVLLALGSIAAGCRRSPDGQTTRKVRFVVIGDYGYARSSAARAVAAQVAGYAPDFVVTTGDNNYPNGAWHTLHANIVGLYGAWIGRGYPSMLVSRRGRSAGGILRPGPPRRANRFFPALGNHDWRSVRCRRGECRGPYTRFFSSVLPPPGASAGSNVRYYDVRRGPVHLFVLDSMPRSRHFQIDGEPHGWRYRDRAGQLSRQARWLKQAFARSSAAFRLIVFHHTAYGSSVHPERHMRWPFHELRDALGRPPDLVLGGHNHVYERWYRQGLAYVTVGLSGNPRRYPWRGHCGPPACRARYNGGHGALYVRADQHRLLARFRNTRGRVIDTFLVSRQARRPQPTP